MKTIFYKKSENENGDYWFDDKPYVEWFTLDNFLYSGSVSKYMIQKETNIVKDISVTETKDQFSDNGIIRRIALYIAL